MRILQVVHGFPPLQRAGTEIYTYYLSRELSKRHEVHVFYPERVDVAEPTLTSYTLDGLILHELRLPHWRQLPIWSRVAEWFRFNDYIDKQVESIFRKFLKTIKFDVVHFQHLIGLSATLIEVAKELGIPTVLTLHDFWFMCPNIQLLKYDGSVCHGPEPGKCRVCWVKTHAEAKAEHLSRKFHMPRSMARTSMELLLLAANKPEEFERRQTYLKRLLLTVDKIVAPSKFLREVFIRYGIPEDKIVYSENGYDLSVFNNFTKKKRFDDRIIFGFVGHISRIKGVHVLVDAFIDVPEDKAKLRIYGRYNPHSSYFRELVKKAEGKKNIEFAGPFEDPRLPYSEIDVLVVPSIWPETGGPLVVREALASGTPVIASRIGSIPELIVDGVNGLLFEPNNPKDLYEKIMKIIENPDLIEKFKPNIRPPRSIVEQAREIEEIYHAVISKSSKKL